MFQSFFLTFIAFRRDRVADSHLHEFMIGDERFGVPDEDDDFLPYPVHAERRVQLDTVPSGRRNFDYLYDFGDSWERKLRVEKTRPSAPLAHPVCVGGANACPPEDIGGVPSYKDFLRIIQDPSDSEHDYTLEWCGGPFDPHTFDIDLAIRPLKHIKL